MRNTNKQKNKNITTHSTSKLCATPMKRTLWTKVLALSAIFMTMLILNIATALAYYQSHNVSEIREFDADLVVYDAGAARDIQVPDGGICVDNNAASCSATDGRVTADYVYATRFYDSNNAAYYVDPASTSIFSIVQANTGIRTPSLADGAGGAFFDNTCAADEGVQGIANSGAITCQELAVTDTDCAAGSVLLGNGGCVDNYDATDDLIDDIIEWQGQCTNCVQSGDVAFNYAGSTSEGGPALTGDSATAFFSSGSISTTYTDAKCTSATCADSDASTTNELQNLAEVYAQDASTGNAVELTETNGDIRFYNDGASEMIFLDESSGNVGIGTTGPLSRLSVGGIGNSNYAIYGTGSTGVYGAGTSYGVYGAGSGGSGYVGSANYGVRGSNGVNYGYLASSGSGVLGYVGTGGTYGGFFQANDATAGDDYGVRGEAIGASTTNYGVYGTASGATNNFAIHSEGTARVDGELWVEDNGLTDIGRIGYDTVERMYLDPDSSGPALMYLHRANDAVGIGTNSPSSKLSVGGAGNSLYAIYGTGSYGMYGYGTTYGVYGDSDGGAYGYLGGDDTGVYGAGSLYGVRASNSLGTAILASGNINIAGGTFCIDDGAGCNNGNSLDGDVRILDGGMCVGTSSCIVPADGKIYFESELQGGSNSYFQVGACDTGVGNCISDSPTPTITIATGDEDLYIEDDLEVTGSAYKTGGGTWSTISDGRLKTDVTDISGALDAVMKLRPVNFRWIDPDIHHQEGIRSSFIAQEVEEIFPLWVESVPYLGNETDLIPAGDNLKTLNFPHDFNAYIVKAVQELKEEKDSEIDQLKAENSALKELVCLDHPTADICTE